MKRSVFLKRVVLKNYKSIAECSVELSPLNFLVGPNGSGKSNFLDALRFVAESLNTSLDHALRERGGISEVRRRSSGHPTHFGMRVEFALPDEYSGHYAFRIGALPKAGFEVQQEECYVYGPAISDQWFYKVANGKVAQSCPQIVPSAASDRLFLVAVSGLSEFRPLYDALSHMGFYNLNPDEIRDLQTPDAGEILRRDGGNLASVLSVLKRENREVRDHIVEFLSKVVPGVQDVSVKHVQRKETLEFRQKIGSNEAPWRFFAENMSDGTLRALGVLTALFQSANGGGKRIPLVGIEEPEVALHPGAAGVLRDALRVAAANTQVVVTSHSPDLLDDKDVNDEWILAVTNENGETRIGPLNKEDRSLMRDRLFTAGELLKQGGLTPDLQAIKQTSPKQLELFGRAEL
jgi:predicted ATPase